MSPRSNQYLVYISCVQSYDLTTHMYSHCRTCSYSVGWSYSPLLPTPAPVLTMCIFFFPDFVSYNCALSMGKEVRISCWPLTCLLPFFSLTFSHDPLSTLFTYTCQLMNPLSFFFFYSWYSSIQFNFWFFLS